MFKLISATALFAFAVAPAVFAADPAERNIVQVTGQGEAEAPPDGFTLHVSLRERTPDRAEALETLAQKLERVRSAMSGMDGLETAQVTAGEASVTDILPKACNHYDDTDVEPATRCNAIAHSAALDLTVKGRPAARAADALSLLSEFDVANVSFDGFWLEEKSSLSRAARRDAIRNALESARDLAEAANLSLGEIKLISTKHGYALPTDTIIVTGSRITLDELPSAPPPAPQTSLNIDPDPIMATETVVLEVVLQND